MAHMTEKPKGERPALSPSLSSVVPHVVFILEQHIGCGCMPALT